MDSNNDTVSRITNTVARQNAQFQNTHDTLSITQVNMSLAMPTPPPIATSFQSPAATYSSAAPTFQSHIPTTTEPRFTSSAYFVAAQDSDLARVAQLRTQHLVLTLNASNFQQKLSDLTSAATTSDKFSITDTDRNQLAMQFVDKSSATRRRRGTRHPTSTMIPPPLLNEEQQAKKNAEEQIVEILNKYGPYHVLQNHLLNDCVNIIGADVLVQHLSDTTVNLFATSLQNLAPDRTQQQLQEDVQRLPLKTVIEMITKSAPASLPPPAAAPDPQPSTSTAMTTTPSQSKRKSFKAHTPKKIAKLSRKSESRKALLDRLENESDGQWVTRLKRLGFSAEDIAIVTGFCAYTIRYSGYFTEVSRQALEVWQAMPHADTFSSYKLFARDYHKRTLQLNLPDEMKCAILSRSVRTLQTWGIIKRPRAKAVNAVRAMDLSAFETELEKAKEAKRVAPFLNNRDLVGLFDVSIEELEHDTFFLNLSEAGMEAFKTMKRFEGGEGQDPEENADFAARLWKTFNRNPKKPNLTLQDVAIISRLDVTTVRSLWKLKDPTARTRFLETLYPRGDQEPSDWAIDMHEKDRSITLDELCIITKLNAWVITKHPGYKGDSDAAREAAENIPREGRSDYEYAKHLHRLSPDLSASEIAWVSGYTSRRMRRDKVRRGDFAALFGNKHSPMYAKVVAKRAETRRAEAVMVAAAAMNMAPTQVASTGAAAIPHHNAAPFSPAGYLCAWHPCGNLRTGRICFPPAGRHTPPGWLHRFHPAASGVPLPRSYGKFLPAGVGHSDVTCRITQRR